MAANGEKLNPVAPHYLRRLRAPLYIVWEVTLRCNARCLHCYSGAGPGVAHPGELSTAEALHVIDQLAGERIISLGFSGGEPLMRSDIFLLLEHAISKGLRVSVATNGYGVDRTVANRLRELGVHNVTVSLDGAEPATHERVRNMPGLFEKTLDAIRTLVQYGPKITVGYTPTKLNYKDAEKVIELAAGLGAKSLNLTEYVPVGRGGHEIDLTPAEIKNVLERWIRTGERFKDISVSWHDCRVALIDPEASKYDYMGCGAGVLTGRITVDGSVTPCVAVPTPLGNLRERTFSSIWKSSEFLHRLRDRSRLSPSSNCARCDKLNICGGCRATSLAYYNDAFKGDPHCWVLKDTETSA